MGKYSWLTIPNTLSLSRIIMMPVLLWLVHTHPAAFLVLYILVGSTDFFDGLLARKFDWVTPAGKNFDAIGDIVLYLGSAYFLYVLFTPVITANSLYLYVFFVLLALSLLLPIVLFRKLVIMHTNLLKLGAVLVYFLVISSFIFDTTFFTRLILLLYSTAFVEEIIIFIVYGPVNPDTSSIFALRQKTASM